MDADDLIRISIPSDSAYLALVRTLIDKAARLVGFAEDDVGQIVLAVDEACTNIIRHQYDGRPGERLDLGLRLDERAGRIELTLRDYGPVRDPELFRGRDLEEVRPGGLGLHIIRQVMDEVDYAPAPGGGMQLRLVKAVTTARVSKDRGTHGGK